MMIVSEFISQKFGSFGITMSEADLFDISLSARVEPCELLTEDNYASVSIGMARFIPSLLLRASSINESGFSMSWNIDGIKSYYSMLCRQYGLKDELNDNKPKIRFL